MKPTRPMILAAALLAAGLAACSRQEPDAAPTENAIETPEPAPVVAPAPPPLAAPPVDNGTDATAEAEPATPPDEQMMDDAAATGMTARASRDDPSSEDTPAPVDVEQK